MADWSAWIGRTETSRDRCSAEKLAGLAALLDHADSHSRGVEAPPLFHWLHFLPTIRQSAIDRDGHPVRGDFLPPLDLPRRMWAGSRVEFLASVLPETSLARVSTIRAIEEKTGTSGKLAFVTLEHVISADGIPVVREEQDLVYREASVSAAASPKPSSVMMPDVADAERPLVVDPVLLFRFSALTCNAHRIHYDRHYAVNEEGYPGLVVHGPLLATLLMDHALRSAPGRRPAQFAFAARRPLFDGVPFDLCLARGVDETSLWTRDADGGKTMTATLKWATT